MRIIGTIVGCLAVAVLMVLIGEILFAYVDDAGGVSIEQGDALSTGTR